MNERWSTSRLEAFSDGVFAIAITLLILEINVPPGDFNELWKGIADQWPDYLAYATSFLTIGGLWMAHHGIFRRLESADANVLRLNILLLMLVSFLPFPTKLVGESLTRTTSAERAAVIFYGLALLSISVVMNVLWRYVAAHRDLIEPDVSDETIRAIIGLTTPNLWFYIGVLVLAVAAPEVAAVGYLVIAIRGVFGQRGDRKAAPADT